MEGSESLTVPGAVGTDSAPPHQPQPPPPSLETMSAEETAAFAARPGRKLTAAADPGLAKEDSFDAAIAAAVEEEEEFPKVCCCTVIDETSKLRRRWDFVQVIALVYVAVLVPFRTGFEIELEPGTTTWWVELVVDVYFIFDLCLNFATSFYDHDAVLVRSPREIAKNYAKSWLLIDVISCLPVSYVTLIIEAGSTSTQQSSPPNTKVFKILRLLRLAKLLRLGRLKKIIKRYEEEVENLMGVLKLIGAVMVMNYVCHIFACFWYFVGDDEGELEGWITGQMSVWAPGVGEGGESLEPTDVSWMKRYLTAYYWAITTISTVGFGDITAKTTAERLFTIMVEMFGSLMFAVLVGMTGSMMVGQKLLEEKVASQIAELREFMEAKKIPKELRVKIRRYMERLYEEKSGFDEQEVLSQLPPAMAQDLLHHMYKKLVVDVPMFKKLEDGAITMLCTLIKPYTAMKGDHIYVEGEVGREVYIIMQGVVQITFADGDQEEIEKGHTFGEGCLKSLLRKRSRKTAADLQPQKREDTSLAVTDAELKFLSLNDLQSVFDDYPHVRETMTEIYADMNKRRAKRAKGELWAVAKTQARGHPKLLSVVEDAKIASSDSSPRPPKLDSILARSTDSRDSSSMDSSSLAKVEERIEALEKGLGGRIDSLAATVQALASAMNAEAAMKLDQTRNPSAANLAQP